MRNWIDVEGSGRDLILRYYPSICQDGLRKSHEKLQSSSRDMNPGPPEYEPLDNDIRLWPVCTQIITYMNLNKLFNFYVLPTVLHIEG
jgi:hypothetical protein